MRRKKTIQALMLTTVMFVMAGPALGQESIKNFFRSITGALGGDREQTRRGGATSTIGIRGMDDEDVVFSDEAIEDYILMEGWSSTRHEAEGMAAKKDLQARTASFQSSRAVEDEMDF